MSLVSVQTNEQKQRARLAQLKEVFEVFCGDATNPEGSTNGNTGGTGATGTAHTKRTISSDALLARLLSDLGVAPNETDLKDIIRGLDTTGGGEVGWSGFLKLMQDERVIGDDDEDFKLEEPLPDFKEEELLATDNLEMVFQEMDKDKDGLISVDDLQQCFSDARDAVTVDQILGMCYIIDPAPKAGDKPYGITQKMFVRAMQDRRLLEPVGVTVAK